MAIIARLAAIRQKMLNLPKLDSSWNNYLCMDCQIIAPAYMVKNEVWLEAHDTQDGNLCLWCLERRLKRKLVIEDFIDYPINAVLLFGYRIRCDES